LLQDSREYEGGDTCHELVERGVVRNLIQLEQYFDPVHQIEKGNRITVVRAKSFPEEKDCQQLMLGIRSPGVFTGIERNSGRTDCLKTGFD
jgi:hypothetical protein